MAQSGRRFGLPTELGVAALVVAASLPLGRLFRTGEIGVVSFTAAAGGCAVAWGLRRLRAPALVSAAASFAGFVWFASLAFFRDAMLGPLPSPRSISLLWDATVEGVRRSQSDAAPVPASVSFLCLAAFAVWATSWLADDAAVKLRHPMLAIGVTVPLFVLPGTIVEGSRQWMDVGLYLAAALWVLFQDEQFRLARWGKLVGSGSPGWRPGLAARIGITAILLALVATPVLPGYGKPPGLQGITGGDGRVAINPLVSIRPQLSDRSVSDAFVVRSSVPTYWRLTALDRFNGIAWTSGPQQPSLPVGTRTIAPQNAGPGTRITQEVEIRNLGGPWVPVAWEPLQVRGLRGIGADPNSRTVITGRDLRYGSRYQVISRVPRLTFDELAAAPVTSNLQDPNLALPDSPQTQRVAEITQDIIVTAGIDRASPFVKAVALQNHLRTFSYNEDVAQRHSINDIVAFLTRVREGYCEQFATAMAVMARTLGIPSRVAIGFAVGEPGNTPDEYVITSRQAHAWVELFISGFGWVTFEPTPRSESVVQPGYTVPAAPTTEPTTQPTAEPTTSPTARPSPSPGRIEEGETPAPPPSERNKWITIGLGVASGLALLIAAFPLASHVRRRLRYRRAVTPAEQVTARYLDFLDWCAAVRLGRARGETPIQHARRLAEASSNDEGSLEEFARLVTRAVYAAPNGVDAEAAARLGTRATDVVSPAVPRRVRVLAASGWGWWRSSEPNGLRSRRRAGELPR